MASINMGSEQEQPMVHHTTLTPGAMPTLLVLLLLITGIWSWKPTISRRASFVHIFGTVGTPLVVNAEADSTTATCDEACRQEIIQKRRTMLQQSRSTTSRQELFELSRQRAALYNTTYQGATCPNGLPCW